LNLVPELPVIFDEPFADSSQIPAYIISEFARRSVTVCLSGDGGDELFAGYNRYLSTDRIWRKLSFLPFPIRKILGMLLAIPPVGLWDNIYDRIPLRAPSDDRQKHIGLKLQKLAGLMQKNDLMSGYDYLLSYWDSPEEILSLDNINCMVCPEAVLPETSNFIEKATFLDQTEYLQGDNLAKVDRASMAVSLETRLPLLSHEIVELSWRLPVSMKARRDKSKWILRQVLHKYIPENLIERPKMGFSVPVAQWLREDLREWATDMLELIPAKGPDFLRQKAIMSAWDDHLHGKRDNSQKLWTVLMLLSWMNAR
jgi:asparagine synthase (glutamine-hydrolysing)